jgi:hypothetical protein
LIKTVNKNIKEESLTPLQRLKQRKQDELLKQEELLKQAAREAHSNIE